MTDAIEQLEDSMKRLIWCALVLGTIALLPGRPWAANLIQNGDFEVGSLAGWEVIGDTTVSTVGANHFAYVNDADSNGVAGIAQSFFIQPEAVQIQIAFDFLFAVNSDTNLSEDDIFRSMFFFDTTDGSVVPILLESAFSSGGSTGVVHFDAVYRAGADLSSTNPNARINFRLKEAARDTDSWVGVDNVSVRATVPEPGTVLLVGSGLLGLAGVVRRRRSS